MRKGKKFTSDRRTKTIEYPDSPSGTVTIYNYKEPFVPFSDGRGSGFGYEGVLLLDPENDKVQCHFCGDWFDRLNHHLKREHNMNTKQYKSLTGLHNGTALVNEAIRTKYIEASKKNPYPVKGNRSLSKETRMKIADTVRENRMQKRNLLGTCPLQLIDKLKRHHKKLGRTPTWEETWPYRGTLIKVWGSFENACNRAGIPYRGKTDWLDRAPLYSKEDVKDFLKTFHEENGYFPGKQDFIKAGRKKEWDSTRNLSKYKQEWMDYLKEVFLQDGRYRVLYRKKNHCSKDPINLAYTNSELLSFLKKFETHHGRPPSQSDTRRGFLPSHHTYTKHFGSFKEALKIAGIA